MDSHNSTKIFSVRMTEEEYRALSERAANSGYKISQLIRNTLFGGKQSEYSARSTDVSSSNYKAKDIQSLREILQKNSSDINQISKTYERSLSIKNSSGEPAISQSQTRRYLQAATSAFNSMKDSIDALVSLISPENKSASSSDNKTSSSGKAFTPGELSSFMVNASGKVCSSVNVYERLGNERVSFQITVSEISSGKKWLYTVLVDAKKDDALLSLKRGAAVCALGSLHIELDTDSVLPNLKIILFAKEIELI